MDIPLFLQVLQSFSNGELLIATGKGFPSISVPPNVVYFESKRICSLWKPFFSFNSSFIQNLFIFLFFSYTVLPPLEVPPLILTLHTLVIIRVPQIMSMQIIHIQPQNQLRKQIHLLVRIFNGSH